MLIIHKVKLKRRRNRVLNGAKQQCTWSFAYRWNFCAFKNLAEASCSDTLLCFASLYFAQPKSEIMWILKQSEKSKQVRRLPHNYGIIGSWLKQKYSLRTKIAWNVLYHITHDIKVEECISMCISMYKYVQLLSFKPK